MSEKTLAQKFCFTFKDRVKSRGVCTLAGTIAAMRELQSEFPFIGRWIVMKNEPIGVEFVFADKSSCATYYDRPGVLHTQPSHLGAKLETFM